MYCACIPCLLITNNYICISLNSHNCDISKYIAIMKEYLFHHLSQSSLQKKNFSNCWGNSILFFYFNTYLQTEMKVSSYLNSLGIQNIEFCVNRKYFMIMFNIDCHMLIRVIMRHAYSTYLKGIIN